MDRRTPDETVRVGVFSGTADAEQAIENLCGQGFGQSQISVICSDQKREEIFKGVPHPPLPRAHLGAAVAEGGTVGAVLAGLVALTGITTTGGVALAAVGPMLLAMGGGAITGGFFGAMMTRGVTREFADYYDQAVTEGKILVAVEDRRPGHMERLAKAEKALEKAGAHPVPLTPA